MNKKLKILHISSPGYRSAGKMAFDIHSELIKKGMNSFIVTKSDSCGIDWSFSFENYRTTSGSKIIERVKKIVSRKINFNGKQDPKYGYHWTDHSKFQEKYLNLLDFVPFKPDIIILYALQEFINLETVFHYQKITGAHIYWMFYDMAPLTGGCHYSWECENYTEKCGKCPWLYSSSENDLSEKNLRTKKRVLDEMKIHPLICSEWLFTRTAKSSLFKDSDYKKWYFPVDINEFKPEDKINAKKRSDLDHHKKHILFGSVDLTNERKGANYLIEAINILKEKSGIIAEPEIIILGNRSEEIVKKIPFRVIFQGFLNNREDLIRYYQASDITVVPSLQDAGPLMTSESLACGTPVVSFNVGSAQDFVSDGLTGYRSEYGNTYRMAEGIKKLLELDESSYTSVSENCRKTACNNFGLELQTENLIDILSSEL
ncbi:MAG TPA: glycosyltransferase [Clostridiales bacterium]|nr:glycosyltransferase [Clostridiales bacterium]HQP69964.1 glycosyltransferase [Clostridiales bacterium]